MENEMVGSSTPLIFGLDAMLVFNWTMIAMVIIGVLCFIALFFVKAGYGKFRSKSWGVSFNNKIAWVLMEIPTLIVLTLFIIFCKDTENIIPKILVVGMFLFHYVQRTFVFPFLIKGKSEMPLSIVAMGFTFNTINALLIGGWVFVLSPKDMYTFNWLTSPVFLVGLGIFLCGFVINVSSDSYIRSLRKPGDTKHYFPCKGLYRYVSSANYFGEIIEWIGFAIATWSLPGVLFVYWTACNLVPRSYSINKSYKEKFPEEFEKVKPKCIIPFVF